MISVAYVQGKSSESTLPPNDWTRIIRKLNQIGGLYIYKDNIPNPTLWEHRLRFPRH